MDNLLNFTMYFLETDYLLVFLHLRSSEEFKSKIKNKSKSLIIFKPLRWSIKQSVWITKAAKIQRHIKKNFSTLAYQMGVSARVFLRLLLNIFSNQIINPKAQSKRTSSGVYENLNVKPCYVFTRFVPLGFFHIYISNFLDISDKNVTGPERIKANASLERSQSFFLFAFGVFLLATHKAFPIKNRRGVGAGTMYSTSFCENVFVFYTFAVSFFFPVLTLYIRAVQTRKS